MIRTARPAVRPALLIAVLVACQAQGTARAGDPVVVRDDTGATTLTLTRTATGCATDHALVITVAGGRTSAGAWTLGPGATGRELRGPAGLVARVVEDAGPPRRLSLIDDVGVPMAHTSFGDAAAIITSRARRELGAVEPAEGGLVMHAGGAPRFRVTGTTDLELGTRLTVPAPLSSEARALLACERLAAITPAVK
jgi:hypothetical protein